jgi:hypothetical protein
MNPYDGRVGERYDPSVVDVLAVSVSWAGQTTVPIEGDSSSSHQGENSNNTNNSNYNAEDESDGVDGHFLE